MPVIKRALPIILAAGALAAATAHGAQASAHRAGAGIPLVNHSGTYNGQIDQLQPRAYTGHIHFVVRQGRITGLRFTAGALCGTLWVLDTDHSLPTFPLKLASGGLFSYRGTVAGRLIQIRGSLRGNQARGTFFQAFPWGQTTCTMGQAASFTATR